MSDQTQATENQPSLTASTAFDDIPDVFIPLDQFGVAPENLRADDGPDEDIPQLGDILFFAGQIHSILVRPGKGRKEDPYMALDGRRRRFAWLHNVEQGRIPADHPVRVKIITDRKLQVAAATLPNTEQQAPDLVHLIRAIGRLVKRKMSPADIAKALGGYKTKEVAGWAALADLEDGVLDGVRAGRITLRQAKLMTKLSPEDQNQLSDHARLYGRLSDDAVRVRLNGAIVTVGDARLRLVGLDDYKAAGGRVESDLFEEVPDRLLDQAILQQVWDVKTAKLATHLTSAGIKVFSDIQAYSPPEGFQSVPHLWNIDVPDEQQEMVENLDAACNTAEAVVQGLTSITDDSLHRVVEMLDAQIAYVRAHGIQIGACNLVPDARTGVKAILFAVPQPEPEDNDTRDVPDSGAGYFSSHVNPSDPGIRRHGDVDIPRVALAPEVTSHSLVERYTDIATRGLIRSLADDPSAALILLVARLFVSAGLQFSAAASDGSSISTLKADAYRRQGHQAIDVLDGEVFVRLEQRRAAYLESGQRPIPWVAGLSHGERMTFLAELMAITLDGREFATHAPRHAARAEAIELVELTGHDIRNHWLPDLDFFTAHTKGQLLGMLEKMSEDPAQASTLKKADLAARVTAAAGDHNWAPEALSWTTPAPTEVNDETSDESETAGSDGDHVQARAAEDLGTARSSPTPETGILASVA